MFNLITNTKNDFLISFGSIVAANTKWNATFADKLKRDLLLNYDKYSRPAEFDSPTNVNIGFELIHFDLDEVKSIFTVHGWLKMVKNKIVSISLAYA
jgi:hypothetical protein